MTAAASSIEIALCVRDDLGDIKADAARELAN